MKNFRHNKKGVSPIIATLLLIVIAVAAAVVTYAFVSGFIGTATSQTSQQGTMSIDTGSISVNGQVITVYLRNTGTKTESLGTAYVDNVLKATGGTVTVTWGANNPLAPNQVTTVTITDTAMNWADGSAHLVKLLANDGTPSSLSVHS